MFAIFQFHVYALFMAFRGLGFFLLFLFELKLEESNMSTASNSILNLPSVYNVEVAAFHRTLHYICDQHEINVLSKNERILLHGCSLPAIKISYSELSLCFFQIHECERIKLRNQERDASCFDEYMEVSIGVVVVLYFLLQLVDVEPEKTLRRQGVLVGKREDTMVIELRRSLENISCLKDLIQYVSPPVRERLVRLLSPRQEKAKGSLAERFIFDLFYNLDIKTFESFVCIFKSRNLSLADIAEKYARKYNNQQGEGKANFHVTPLEWTCAMIVALRTPIGGINIRGKRDLPKLDTARVDHNKDYTLRNFAFASAEHNRIDQQKKQHAEARACLVKDLRRNVEKQIELLNNLCLLKDYM